MDYKAEVKTKFDDDIIAQTTDIAGVKYKQVIKMQDDGVKQALSEMGWKTPEESAELESQRDQLREALELVLAVTYGGEAAHKQKTCPVYKAARAALKSTEE